MTGIIVDNISRSSGLIKAAAAGGGKVLQVVNATDSTQRSMTGTTFLTGSNTLSLDITPSSTSSKIFLFSTFSGIE